MQKWKLAAAAAAALAVPSLVYFAPSASAGEMPPAQGGQIVITEILKDPSHVTDARGEWIEVYNAMPWRMNLEGWILGDDQGGQHVIDVGGAGLLVGPGRYLVLGASADPALNGGVQVDYAWGGVSLANGADSVVLWRRDGLFVDRVACGRTLPDARCR
jgi:hypothetical protein